MKRSIQGIWKQSDMRSRSTIPLKGKRFDIVRYHRVRLLQKTPRGLIHDRAQRLEELQSGNSSELIQYRSAKGRQELEGAFELLQQRYCEAGLASSERGRLRVLPFHLWRQTQVFVAVQDERVIGCVTLVSDTGSNSLPIDVAYPSALRQLRRQGERIGEISCLAIAASGSTSSTKLFVELTRRMTFYARELGLTQLAAVVHPRHAAFYRHAMGFKVIGPSASQSHVEGHAGLPILGLVNDPSVFQERWRASYFDSVVPRSEIRRRPMSDIDREYFRASIRSAPQILRAA